MSASHRNLLCKICEADLERVWSLWATGDSKGLEINPSDELIVAHHNYSDLAKEECRICDMLRDYIESTLQDLQGQSSNQSKQTDVNHVKWEVTAPSFRMASFFIIVLST